MQSKITFIRGLIFFTSLMIYAVNFTSAAHYITGMVNNSRDGIDANGRIAVLWKLANGISDNVTDVIGTSGNSGTSNTYLIDCELLESPCDVGDIVAVMVIGESITRNVSGVVGGFGFDVLGDLRLNSLPNITSVVVDDALQIPANEIDLIPNGTRLVTCEAAVYDADGEGELGNASARFYHITDSFDDDGNDNNKHYSNSSCLFDASYGNENQSRVTCSFLVKYYANSGLWNCNMTVEDNYTAKSYGNDTTQVNGLLALEVQQLLDYGLINATGISDERIINVTNYGNVDINLSIYGYGEVSGDNLSFNCTGGNISASYEKYNLTASNPGVLDLSQFQQIYTNLTGSAITRKFELSNRQSDIFNDAINQTYWRVYIPRGVWGTCNGNLLFTAVQEGEL